jgi:hypothetical protein
MIIKAHAVEEVTGKKPVWNPVTIRADAIEAVEFAAPVRTPESDSDEATLVRLNSGTEYIVEADHLSFVDVWVAALNGEPQSLYEIVEDEE